MGNIEGVGYPRRVDIDLSHRAVQNINRVGSRPVTSISAQGGVAHRIELEGGEGSELILFCRDQTTRIEEAGDPACVRIDYSQLLPNSIPSETGAIPSGILLGYDLACRIENRRGESTQSILLRNCP